MTEIELLEHIKIILGCILALNILNFSFKWCVKPLADWFSSLFPEGGYK